MRAFSAVFFRCVLQVRPGAFAWRCLLLVVACAIVPGTPPAVLAQAPAGNQIPEIDSRSVSLDDMVVRAVWRVKASADPAYAQPEIDDSAWSSTEPGGILQGASFHAFQPLWYRTHVRVAAGDHHLAMFLAQQYGPDRFYVNGVLVDSYGRFGPGQGTASFAHHFFRIPATVLRPDDNVLAIQTNAGPDGAPFFGSQTVLIAGPASVLTDYLSLLKFQNFVSNTTEVLIEALLLLLSSALMVTMRKEGEYRALVGLVACLLLADALQIWILAVGLPRTASLLLAEIGLDALGSVLLVELIRELLRVPLSWHFRVLYGVIAGSGLPLWLASSLQVHAVAVPAPVLGLTWWLYHLGVSLPQIALPFVCLTFALRRRSLEFALLAVPLLAEGVLLMTVLLSRLHLLPDLYDAQLIVGTLYVKWAEISRILLGSTLLLFLMLRTVRIARERAAVAREIEAAQSVQQLLLGASQAAVPGFRVETAYLPASEVGGDFFHMAPGEDGSLLVVAGDVSGKGLKAAMTVSAIVGSLRSVSNRAPAAVLRQLNRMLTGHMDGFATCCAVLIGADGQMLLANAGHLSPYLNDTEMELLPNLPLGLDVEIVYEETRGVLPGGGRLVFPSDGVVEAADPRSRELFGFERVKNVARLSAEDIAEAARRFGQTDDITVVVVERPAVSAAVMANAGAPAAAFKQA